MMQRVAAYCRVSTDSSDQTNSLASQEKYFRAYIDRNPEWELSQIFVDSGITGTSTKKRPAFNKMISDAISGQFSLILTKEISRFARNTLDSIYYTRQLKEHGVGVIFLNDNINTLDPDAELRLTIMSSIAQEESRKTSERVKWGQKRRMEQGVVFGRDLLGYDVRDGKLYVNEEGAEIVRLIFHKFVDEGKGTHIIARELREAGIQTSAYMKQWSNTAILRVLRNEKAVGDLVQKKTITPNYLTHEKKYNKGEEEFVILHNHHEAIISRELFDCAMQELARRSPNKEQKSKYSNRYCFSGKIKCAVCGSSFVSRKKKRKDGSIYKAWRCCQAAACGRKHIDNNSDEVGCNCPSVNEDALKFILQTITASLLLENHAFIKTVGDVVAAVLQEAKQTDNGRLPYAVRKSELTKIEVLREKKQRLIELYITNDITKTEFRQKKEMYDKDIESLKEKIKMHERQMQLQENQTAVLDDMRQFMEGLVSGKNWNDRFYRNLLHTITVEGDNTLTISLNALSCKWYAVLQDTPLKKKI